MKATFEEAEKAVHEKSIISRLSWSKGEMTRVPYLTNVFSLACTSELHKIDVESGLTPYEFTEEDKTADDWYIIGTHI